jgi:hypothetical protein
VARTSPAKARLFAASASLLGRSAYTTANAAQVAAISVKFNAVQDVPFASFCVVTFKKTRQRDKMGYVAGTSYEFTFVTDKLLV